MESIGIANVLGNPVEGTSFFGREREASRLWRRLHTDNVLLLAPRRVGKTSLMWHLRDAASSNGFIAHYLSVGDAVSETDFARALDALPRSGRALRRMATGPASRWMARTRKLGALGITLEFDGVGGEPWTDFTSRWTRAMLRDIKSPHKRLLLLVDELPLFVTNLARLDPTATRARGFLQWFRQLRQAPASNAHIRWLIAGSEKLGQILDVLHNDGYLLRHGERWRFRSPLLAEYWRRRLVP